MMDAGGISYVVEVETAQTLKAQDAVNKGFDKLEKGMDGADKAAKGLSAQMNKTASSVQKANREISGASSAMSGLYKIMTAYVGLRTVQAVIAMSDQYGQMASRVRQVTKDTAEYEMVQRRLLDTANKTYRPLAEAQEVFIRTADSIRDLGYNTSQAMDITDSFSFLLVTNAASADRANSAISAYSKSIQTGKIQSEQWQSILAAMPTVVDGIAAATGRSREEIKKLGVEGKLSIDALNEGLRRSRDENEQLAETMETSVADAFTALRNSMQVFIGKVNESSEASGVLTQAVGEMSEALQDPETIKAAQDLASGVVRWLMWLADSAKDVVGVVKWAADELAAAMHGAASDDIVRLEKQADNLRAKLNKSAEAKLVSASKFGIVGAPTALAYDAIFGEDDEAIAKKLKETELLIKQFYENTGPKSGNEPPKLVTAPSEKDIALVDAVAAKTEKATKARKGLTEAQRAAKKAAEDQARAEEQNANVIERLREAIYQTTLSAEALAQRKAELSLNSFATPDEVETVRQLAAELYKLEEIENRRAAFTGRGGDGDVGGQIRGDVSPLSGGKFDDQTARYEAEAEAEKQRYAEQLERLKEAKELELEVKGGYAALEEQMYQEHIDRMNQIDTARKEMQMQQWADGFGQMSSDLMEFAEVFASENKAMFNIAKAAAITETIINTYSAAQKAYASMAGIPYVGPALGIAAAAAAVGAGMARVAKIRSQSMPGKALGGPVQASQMYRVNENGPEIFNAANGRQYMIPNQRGDVVSNREASRQGASSERDMRANVTVNQNITVSGRIDRYTSSQLAGQSAQKQRVSMARFGK